MQLCYPGRFSSLLTGMDVTCGILFSTDSATMAQLECALLSSNYEDIEKYSKKLKKKRELSLNMEIVLDCYVGIHRQIRLHAASLELDLTHLLAYQIKTEISDKFKEKLKKVLMMEDSGDNSEIVLKLAYILLGLVCLFSKDSLKDSLAYFDKIDFDLSKKVLLYEPGDTEIIQSSLIEKIFGILGLYFRGVALELHGNKEDACDQYQVITDFLTRFRVQQFTQSKSVHDFLSAAIYRSGCLLNQLAHFKESAAMFRSFLNFIQVNPHNQSRQPPNSTIRLIRAFAQYMDLLDRKFRRYNFKTFCDEQQQQIIISTNQINNSNHFWHAENVQEEIILCSMLLSSIRQSPLVKQAIEDLRLDSIILRRFARIGYLDGISKIQKSHFQSKTANLEIYRNLFHSLMSSDGKKDLALLSAKMYLQGHGMDLFTLLLISKLFLSLPDQIDEAYRILNEILDCEQFDVSMQIPYFLLRGRYNLIKGRQSCQFVDVGERIDYLNRAVEEFKFVLQVDENNAEAHFYLSLISCENFNFEEAEKFVKKSLSLDSSQIRAWTLFALLKSAKKDYESVLNICNTELSNMIQKDLNLSLLRVSTLLTLSRSDEAIETLKRIISAHLRKSDEDDIKMDGGMTVISEGTLGPGNFLSKFLGDLNDFGNGRNALSVSNSESDCSKTVNTSFEVLFGMMGKFTTFQEYTESFPLSLEEYLLKDKDGNLLLPKAISLKDLKSIRGNSYQKHSNQNNNNNDITSLWIEVARVYLREGLLQDAEEAVNQAYHCNEIFAPIFGTFGLIEEARIGANNNISSASSLLENAESFYRKGLSIDSNDESCLLGLSRVLIRSNDPSKLFESECLARRLIQMDPSVSEAWSILAQCCSGTGRNEEALKYFEIALKREEQCPLRSIRSIQ